MNSFTGSEVHSLVAEEVPDASRKRLGRNRSDRHAERLADACERGRRRRIHWLRNLRIIRRAPSRSSFCSWKADRATSIFSIPSRRSTSSPGKPMPESFGRPLTSMGTVGNTIMPTKRKWAQHGQSGLWVSDWYPNVAQHADDLAVIRSCWADGLNHVGSVCQMNTGAIIAGRPSLGAWLTYGLGTANANLPTFVILTDNKSVVGGAQNWSSGFLPAAYQGTLLQREGPPILHLNRPETDRRRTAARAARSAAGPEPAPCAEPADRERAGCADRIVRTGVSHADGGAGSGEHRRRIRDHAARCTDWTIPPPRHSARTA